MASIVANGEVIVDIRKIRPSGNTLIVEHTTGDDTVISYSDANAAQTARDSAAAALGAVSLDIPIVTSITPNPITHAGLPTTITVNGVNFDSSAAITLVAYGITSTVLATTFTSANQLTATVPNTVVVGVYDVVYSDSNGNVFTVPNGLVVE